MQALEARGAEQSTPLAATPLPGLGVSVSLRIDASSPSRTVVVWDIVSIPLFPFENPVTEAGDEEGTGRGDPQGAETHSSLP